MKKLAWLSSLVIVLALALFVLPNTGKASTTLLLEAETPLYNEASLTTEVGAKITPQTVEVLQTKPDGWYQIVTWLGPKWVAPNGVKIPLDVEAFIYNSDSLTDPHYSSALSPQTLTVLDQKTNGWWKVKTWLGDKWIAPHGVKVYVDQKTALHNKPSFLSKAGSSISAQTVTVLEQRTDGWWKIKTWLGDKWVAPNGAALVLDKQYALYNTASFSDKNSASISAQQVTTLDQVAGGWIKIKTWLGDKWININGENAPIESFKLPVVGSYTITSTYGYRTIFGSTSWHDGIDLARGGTVSIVAVASGTVTRSYTHATYGEVVMVQHSINGQVWETVYAHLQTGSRTVSVGAKVTQGQRLGYMGSTGRSTGQHLHFELHKGPWGQGNSVDPSLYINF